jgi:MscS family membrane protein
MRLRSRISDEENEPLAKGKIPGTEITIARVEEGARKGEYLFSPGTVDRAREFYQLARQLPYQRQASAGDLVRAGQLFTGWMIPLAWIEALPSWTKVPFLGQLLWKWFAVLVLFGVSVSVVIAIFRWSRRAYSKDNRLFARWQSLLALFGASRRSSI